MPNPDREESGSSCIARFMERPAETRGRYGWVTVVFAYVVLLMASLAIMTGAGVGVAILGQSLPKAFEPVKTVLQLAAIAAWIPVIWLIARFMFKMRLGDLASCEGRFRRAPFFRALVISLVGLGVFYVGSAIVAKDALVPLSTGVIAAIALALVLIPLQALAEEYAFRAFGPQIALGKLGFTVVRYAVMSTIFSAVFASVHGAADVATWIVYFILGAILAAMTYMTGGIEAPAALHVANNVLFVVSGILTGKNLAATQADVSISAVIIVQVVFMALVAAAAVYVERRKQGGITDAR